MVDEHVRYIPVLIQLKFGIHWWLADEEMIKDKTSKRNFIVSFLLAEIW